MTEPGGGTDLAAMQTTARAVSGGNELRGDKVFISHAAHAGLFFVVATLDRAQKHAGVTAFLVDPRRFPILGSALDMGRFSVAARCVGQAQRCVDLALPYAGERKSFGQAIGQQQLIQHRLANMICRLEQARLLVYRLGRMKDAGLARCSIEASMAKLCASRAAVQNALDGIQIFGAYGLSADFEIGRLLLDAKALEIGEGTGELHEKLIAEYALGLRSA